MDTNYRTRIPENVYLHKVCFAQNTPNVCFRGQDRCTFGDVKFVHMMDLTIFHLFYCKSLVISLLKKYLNLQKVGEFSLTTCNDNRQTNRSGVSFVTLLDNK